MNCPNCGEFLNTTGPVHRCPICTIREHVGIEKVMAKLGMGQPLMPDPELGQDVAFLAHVITENQKELTRLNLQLDEARRNYDDSTKKRQLLTHELSESNRLISEMIEYAKQNCVNPECGDVGHCLEVKYGPAMPKNPIIEKQESEHGFMHQVPEGEEWVTRCDGCTPTVGKHHPQCVTQKRVEDPRNGCVDFGHKGPVVSSQEGLDWVRRCRNCGEILH